jgi:hypothetical protein
MARRKFTITVTFLILRKNNRCVSLLLHNVRLTQKKRPTYKVCVPLPHICFRSGDRMNKNTRRHTDTRQVMKRQGTCRPLSPGTTMWECRCSHASMKKPTLSNSERKSYRNNKRWTAITDATSSLLNSTHIMSIMFRLLRSNQLSTSSTICGIIIRRGRNLFLI